MKTLIAALAFLFLICVAGIAQQTAPTSTSASGANSVGKLRLLDAWRASMIQIPPPKKGSFEASYPDKVWREVPSVKASPYPMVPRQGPRPLVVGNGDDVSAEAPTGHISSATGSFDSVTGVTSESGPIGNAGPSVADAYTLQLNTDHFPSTLSGSPAGCTGWAQFVFANDGASGAYHGVYIQYWLINYGTTSPGTGWIQGPAPNYTSDWYRNSNGTAVPNQPIGNLANLSMNGIVSATGDTAILSTGANMYMVAGGNEVNAFSSWTIAEFNIFGDGGNGNGGGTATFNNGSSIVTRTRITYGGTAPPQCTSQGFTAEMNNLSFGPTAPSASAPGPAVEATESSAGGATANCSAASTVGDTHLTTFKGLLYDFQASGEFVLAEVDPDFIVQARQVSGAPTWPNASVNSAIATRMGKTRVAICLDGLTIDSKAVELRDNKSISVPGGVDVTRRGNVYFITSQNGNSVRATVNTTWIDVSVGLGNCCANVKGLLANHDGNVNQIAARDGTVLTNPFKFEELYRHYADSWRVSPRESLLPPCGRREFENGIPRIPFDARDLEPNVYERARAVAKAVGVKEGPLLDAATLDVAVIGDERAAQVFVTAHPPISVGRFDTSTVIK